MRNCQHKLSAAAAIVSLCAAGLALVYIFLDLSTPWSLKHPAAMAPYQQGMSLEQAFATLPPAHKGRVWLLHDNTEAWVARWRLIAKAKERIDVSYFILNNDLFGLSFLGHLLHKADEDVEIRVLLDAYGSSISRPLSGNDFLDELVRHRNIEVRVYRPMHTRILEAVLEASPSAMVASDHDKVLLVDETLGLTGGRNIGADYMAHSSSVEHSFRDLDVLIESAPTTSSMRRAFLRQYASQHANHVGEEHLDLKDQRAVLDVAFNLMDSWLREGTIGESLAKRALKVRPDWLKELRSYQHLTGKLPMGGSSAPLEVPVSIVDSVTRPFGTTDDIGEMLQRLLSSARHRIIMISPYLVLPRKAVRLLKEASERDVVVWIITNGPTSSDNMPSQAVFLEQWPDILAQVSSMRLFVAGGEKTLHSKAFVFDDSISVIGSYNLDPASMMLNSEVASVIESHQVTRELSRLVEDWLDEGPPLFYEYRLQREGDRPLKKKSGEWTIAFGPADHLEIQEKDELQLLRKTYEAIEPWIPDSVLFAADGGD